MKYNVNAIFETSVLRVHYNYTKTKHSLVMTAMHVIIMINK